MRESTNTDSLSHLIVGSRAARCSTSSAWSTAAIAIWKVGTHLEKHEMEKINAELKEKKKREAQIEPFSILSIGVGRRSPHYRASERGTGREGTHCRRSDQCP